MPMRNMLLRTLNDGILITPRALRIAENNVFDKAFNNEVDIETWQDWMRWDGSAEVDFPMPDCNLNREWATNVGGIESHAIPTSPPEELRTIEDAPFELDDETAGTRDPYSLINGSQLASQTTQRGRREFLSLTEAEERKLQEIAMPYQNLAIVKTNSSPVPSLTSQSSPSPYPSPAPDVENNTRSYRKRKASGDDDVPFALCQSRKRGHNAIEKRYRTNLNDKIVCLRRGIPSFSHQSSLDSKSGDEEDSDAETEGKTAQQKYGKAAILTRALEYIKHLENTTQRLGGEADALRTRVEAFEKLAMGGSLVLNGNRIDVSNRPQMAMSETLETIQNGTS